MMGKGMPLIYGLDFFSKSSVKLCNIELNSVPFHSSFQEFYYLVSITQVQECFTSSTVIPALSGMRMRVTLFPPTAALHHESKCRSWRVRSPCPLNFCEQMQIQRTPAFIL